MKILAILTDADTVRPCLDAAVMAARINAAAIVEALHVVVDPERLVASTEEIQIQRLREAQEGTARDKASAAQAAFLAWNAASDDDTPHVRWRAPVGAEAATIIDQAKDADLLVVAHAVDLDDQDARHAALRETGKPLLLVPEGWRPHPQGFAHIAVGLSDTQTMEHAAQAALPWLRAASAVTALWIGDERQEAQPVLDRLRGTGVAADLRIFPPEGEDRGVTIVLKAKEVGADLLVAGAYRHGPLVEWLMGCTTRQMLACSDLPLMLAH
jgi:nucleotide-binding universal stress UspA family protein